MKKLLASALLLVMLVIMAATTSMAATNADLIAYVTSDHSVAGGTAGLTADQRVRAKRYLTENPVTDEQASAIIAKGDELLAIMEAAGVSDPSQLSKADKENFMKIAQQAADILGLTLVFHAHSVDIYKDGTLIDSGSLGGKLAYTGNSVNLALVISSIATIALAAGFVAKKRLANA